MARKLKVFQASIGFYDVAIAAPSMKAALEAWGADSNLFHQGVAKESEDPDVIAATISKPGIILRRPVGSDGPFLEKAKLPTGLGLDEDIGKSQKGRAKPKKEPSRKIDDEAIRKAALEYKRAERQRESERRKEEGARAKERQRREQAVAKVQEALETAEREHDNIGRAIEAERAAVEKRSQAEDARWEKLRHKLDLAMRRARE